MADTRAETHLHIYDAFTLPHVRARSRVFGYRTRATAAIMSPSTSERRRGYRSGIKKRRNKNRIPRDVSACQVLPGTKRERKRQTGGKERGRARERERDTGGREGGRALRLRNGRRSSALGLRNGKKLCNAPAKSLRSQL